ncbi:MAG: hypothetical protein P8X89_23185 [Reinekea sp.]
MKMRLGGFYNRNSERVQLDLVESPDQHSLMKMLKTMEDKSGVLTLKQKVPNGYEPNKLTLYSENGHYLVMYGSYQEDGDYLVLTLHDESNVKLGMMNILGEPYPACAVVGDFSLVEEVFMEFLSTGRPSVQLKE